MKILFPVLGFIRSGGFRVLSRLSSEATKFGHEVTFVCPAGGGEPYFPIGSEIIYIDQNGNPVKQLLSESEIVKGWRKLFALFVYLRRHSKKYDAVVASFNLTAYPVWLGSSSKNFYYIQAYEPEFYSEINATHKKILLKAIAWFSYFLPLTRIVNANLYKSYKNIRSKHVVVPGLDLNTYYRKRDRLPFSESRSWIVGCIGREEIWKGSNDVGEAVQILHKRGKCIDLKVAYNRVNYANHTLVQPHGDEKLSEYYRSLDILVAPAHIQLGAIHYPVIEAMACGTVVITTGYQPADESNSYLVPTKSPNEIAAIIEKILSSPMDAQKRADKAYQDISIFSWEAVTHEFYRIIASELNKPTVKS